MVIMLDGFLFRCLPLRRGRRIEDRRAFLVGRLLVVGSSDCVRAALENHLFGTRFKGLLAFIREMSDLCHQACDEDRVARVSEAFREWDLAF